MAQTDLPTVTIGIAAFNCEDTLRRAVASALEQDYLNTEILIVDDCSTDHTTIAGIGRRTKKSEYSGDGMVVWRQPQLDHQQY